MHHADRAWSDRESVSVPVQLVTTPNCHLCDDARDALVRLAGEYTLEIEVVDGESPEGLDLVARHRPPFLPMVVVEGRMFSYGIFPWKKLRRDLEARRVSS